MTTTQEVAPAVAELTGKTLKSGAVGIVGVLFMVLANAAPLMCMAGNLPIGIGFGNGAGIPGSFIFATIILTLFAVGYVAMARHLTTAGAFYGFISHGLGQVWGMASGYVATVAYVIFEGSVIGIFSWFAQNTISDWFGVHINWLILAGVGIAIIGLLGYFDINIASKVLGLFLVCEVVLLGLLSFAILFRGGGPDGLVPSALNPINGFQSVMSGGNMPGSSHSLGIKGFAGGSAAIGIFFAFWSWVGFETTAVYGEESRNPRKIVPRATMIAVIGLGVVYAFCSWMIVSGNGVANSLSLASGSNPMDLLQGILRHYLGGWSVRAFQLLTVTGSFACAMAFHNAASRYIYAIGREFPRFHSSLGATHSRHRSPHVASLVQTVVTVLITVAFYVGEGSNTTTAAYVYEYGVLAVLGTMALLAIQALCSLAVIWYFHVKKVHRGGIVATLICPILAIFGMIYALYLLFSNLDFAGGAASGSLLYKSGPYMVIAIFVIGAVTALLIKKSDPERFAEIGRTVLAESHERQAA